MRCLSSRPTTLPRSTGSFSCGWCFSCPAIAKSRAIRDGLWPPCSKTAESCSTLWDPPAAPFCLWSPLSDWLADGAESARSFGRGRFQRCGAGIFTRAGQHEFESMRPYLVDNTRQNRQHDIRSTRQTIVQQNNVSAGHLVQDAPGENFGIWAQGVARPNAPGNELQSRGVEKGLQERVTKAHRRPKQTRRAPANAAHAFGAALDLGTQTRGREKTK